MEDETPYNDVPIVREKCDRVNHGKTKKTREANCEEVSSTDAFSDSGEGTLDRKSGNFTTMSTSWTLSVKYPQLL
jgi:hypothetical protein